MPYLDGVKRAVAMVLLLSLLASAQARAVHWYADHMPSNLDTHTDSVLINQLALDDGDRLPPAADDEHGGSSHTKGHCDVCGHAGMAGIVVRFAFLQAFFDIYDHTVISRDSQVADPPLSRADKPPR
jgi:hypothetical protein